METLNITTAARLDGIGEYYFSVKLRQIEQMRSMGHDIISLGIGSPDRAPHRSVIEALGANASRNDSHGYQSYKGTARLRNAFARWYGERYGVGLDPDSEILPLIGSKEGLMHICMAYLGNGDRALIPDPGYPTYRAAVALSGAEPVTYGLSADNGWMPDLEAIGKSGVAGVKLMIVNYPHMPTGAIPVEGIFESLVRFARRHGILLVHDNPYSFVRNPRPVSILATQGAMDVAVELNSLSKSHNMAGWRIGMAAGRRERMDEILRFKSNMDSGMLLAVQEAAVQALSLGDEWYTKLNEEYYAREKLALKIAGSLGCAVSGRQAGLFVWARIPESFPGDSYAFSDRVLETVRVFITPGGVFGRGGDRYIRISLCAEMQVLNRVIERLNGLAI